LAARMNNQNFIKSGETEPGSILHRTILEVIEDQESEIKLIEDSFRMFQCNSRTTESSRRRVNIDADKENCSRINEIIQLLITYPAYGGHENKIIKNTLRNVFNATC